MTVVTLLGTGGIDCVGGMGKEVGEYLSRKAAVPKADLECDRTDDGRGEGESAVGSGDGQQYKSLGSSRCVFRETQIDSLKTAPNATWVKKKMQNPPQTPKQLNKQISRYLSKSF